jgi:hypothetical protein
MFEGVLPEEFGRKSPRNAPATIIEIEFSSPLL